MKNIKFIFTLFLFLFSFSITIYADLPTGLQYSEGLEELPEEEITFVDTVSAGASGTDSSYSSIGMFWWTRNGKDYDYDIVDRSELRGVDCAYFPSGSNARFFCSPYDSIQKIIKKDNYQNKSSNNGGIIAFTSNPGGDGAFYSSYIGTHTYDMLCALSSINGENSNLEGTMHYRANGNYTTHYISSANQNPVRGNYPISRPIFPMYVPLSWYIYFYDNTGLYNPILASKVACVHENYEYIYTDYNTHGTFCADCGKYLEIEESHDFATGGLNADGICEYGYANNECKCGCNKTIHLSIERYDHKDEYKDKIVFVGHLASPSEAINYSALPKGYRYTDINKESKDLPTHFGYKHETLDGRLIPIYYYIDYEYNSNSFGNLLQYRVSTGSNAEKYYYDVEYESPYFLIPSPNAHLSWKIASVSNASYNDLNFVEIIAKKPFANLIDIHEAKLYLIPNIAIPSSKGSGSSRGGSGGGGGGGGSSDNSLPQNNKNDSNYDSFHNKLVDFDLLSIFNGLKDTFNASINSVKSALSDFSEELKRLFSLNEKIQIITKTTLNKEKSKEPSKKSAEKSKVNLSSGISDNRQKSLNEQIAILTKATLNKEKGRSD